MPAPKTGFGYAIFGESEFGEEPETTTFEDRIKANHCEPIIFFTYDSHVYYGFIDMPILSRSPDISAGTITVRLQNTDGSWNAFLTNPLKLGQRCRLGIFFEDIIGFPYLFTGTVEQVRYEGVTIVFHIRDAMGPMLAKEIGSGQEPVTAYYATYFKPSELAWNILVTYGGLDDEYSTDNQDIDYTSWYQWHLDCGTKDYRLRARFTGHTIQNALAEIARLSNSIIWIDGEGKFNFKMLDMTYSGSEDFTVSNSVEIDPEVTKREMINLVYCHYDYHPDTDIWGEAPSITASTIAFHDNDPSNDTITDSGSGFLAAGFESGQQIDVSDSEKNNGSYTISSVTAGTIWLCAEDELEDEAAGAEVTILDTSYQQTPVDSQKNSSRDEWGDFPYTEENKVIWHDTYESAQTWASAIVDSYGDPQQLIEMQTPLVGLLLDPGERFFVTESLRGLSNTPYYISRISAIDFQRCLVSFEGAYAG